MLGLLRRWYVSPDEISRRDLEFLVERFDFLAEQLKTQTRMMEMQERTHASEVKSLHQRLEMAEGRLTTLDAWVQTVAVARGLGTPSPSGETVYEGFDEPAQPGDVGDDFSLEEMFSGLAEVPVPVIPQTENSPVVDDLIPSDADDEGAR